ncbi:hypothetical protein ACIQGZ_00840 [Streptomyces sp. NPDC092296]|uniref:hypothetical protein n=1 Tax=Streptomyces sp. NPDC092296 TaxID=3366012 RepID=UPI00380F555A
MNFLSEAWHDGTQLAGDAVKVAKDIVMTPVEIAHWTLNAMFGDGGDLHRIAADLGALGGQLDQLSKEIGSTVGGISWHGAAADAFTSHAQGRVRELASAADDLQSLGKSVERLAKVM